MKSYSNNLKFFSLFILVLISLTSCEEKKQETVATKKFELSDSMAHLIQIDSVTSCNVNDEVSLSGEVNFNENSVVKVFPRSSGQVLQASFSLGDHVAKGQVLAIVKSADVAGSYSDLSSTSADVAITKRQMESAQALYKSGISSEREFVEAKQNYEKALAAKSKIQSNITINGGTSSHADGQYIITSPIDGYIVEKKVNAGDFIRSDRGDNLFTISDLKNVWVNANVYEADIPKVKEGYRVEVFAVAYPDKIFIGKVDKLSQVLDSQSKSLRARITIENPEILLKPEMFAKIIVTNSESRLSACVPKDAVLAMDGKNYVVTYNSKTDMNIKEIAVLKTVNNKSFIAGDIKNGQKVITKNQLFIFNQLLEE